MTWQLSKCIIVVFKVVERKKKRKRKQDSDGREIADVQCVNLILDSIVIFHSHAMLIQKL